MNTETHEFWQEIYPADDREIKPPTAYTKNDVTTGFLNSRKSLAGPWTLVSVNAISGHAPGLFQDGRPSHVVVVWAREKR